MMARKIRKNQYPAYALKSDDGKTWFGLHNVKETGGSIILTPMLPKQR
jgi:hypothetical protein